MKGCSFCGNKNFVEKEVQYLYKHDGRMLLINNVPCEECEFCGEQYFKAVTLKKIEEDYKLIYYCHKSPAKELMVPVEEFARL